MAEDAATWVAQEAEELLEQGEFGLYELIWGLRGTDFGLTDAEARTLAARAVGQLLTDGRAQLFAVNWPDFDVVDGPLAGAVLDDPATWSEGRSGPLVAVVPTERQP